MSFAFSQLPTELQIIVLHRVDSLFDRLNFRLVSTWTNTLVLEPCFWSVLSHKARPHHNTILSNRNPHRGGLSIGPHHHPHHRFSLAAALLQPQSDSHFQLHTPYPSASSSSALSHDIGLLPSLTIGTNLPRAFTTSTTTTTPTVAYSPSLASWYSRTETSSTIASSVVPFTTSTEASFLSFVSTLLRRPETAEGIQELLVEGWESEPFLDQLLLLLTKYSFDHLSKLTVRTNALECFPASPSLNNDSTSTGGPLTKSVATCIQLTHLDLKNCQHLYDLSGFYPWMPHLQEINLEGCVELAHIVPPPIPALPSTTEISSNQQQPTLVQPLQSLRKLNLTHTKIGDRELIRLLAQCPQLYELRLDQCYSLTPESISAIGRGQLQSQSQSHQTWPPEQQQHATSEGNSGLTLASSTTNISSLGTSNGSYLTVLSLNNCYDLTDESIRTLAGCRHLDLLFIRGLRRVREDTLDWLHSQGVPLRKALGPLGMWRHWHNDILS